MTEAILTRRERLVEIETILPEIERLAEAEVSYTGEHNPWLGASQRRDDLLAEKRDLERELRGLELQHALDELAHVERLIVQAHTELPSAKATLKTAEEHPTVQRWIAAPRVAREAGLGHCWEILRPWYTSHKTRREAPTQLASEYEPWYPAALRFTDPDRDAIRTYLQIGDGLRRSQAAWSNAQQKKRDLLQSRPELKNVS
jgi:hypothetical protein